jgi:hypothetical protein
MASVRGIFFLNTVDFVCDSYERDAHARILRNHRQRSSLGFGARRDLGRLLFDSGDVEVVQTTGAETRMRISAR